ncbi:hypothetical protein CERSUDRAFT_34627, partial [Gelatoporia subvermispora B]
LSHVHRGTLFEQHSLSVLQNSLSMALARVGGRGDGGVDLQGWWWLPEHPGRGGDARMRIRVLAQCKLERRKLSPKSVRELEGVLLRSMAPLSSGSSTSISVDEQLDPVVGLLISAVPFTKGTVLRAHSSPIPLMLLHLPPPPQISLGDKLTEDAPSMGTFLFNPALGATHGLLRGHVQPRWE